MGFLFHVPKRIHKGSTTQLGHVKTLVGYTLDPRVDYQLDSPTCVYKTSVWSGISLFPYEESQAAIGCAPLLGCGSLSYQSCTFSLIKVYVPVS